MATSVEPIGGSRTVSGSLSPGIGGVGGAKQIVMQWINRGFIFSVMGGLQISAVVLGLLTVSLMGSAMSHSLPHTSAYYIVHGYSFYGFLYIVSYWCFMNSVIILLTSATSVNTASSLPRTTFFMAYHGSAAAFYLFASLATLAEGGKFSEILVYKMNGQKSEDLKTLVFAGGGIGIIECVLYIIITVFGVRKYRQQTEE